MKRIFMTTSPCGILGDACPTTVWLEYFPETVRKNEYVALQEVLVEVPTNKPLVGQKIQISVLDDLTEEEKNKIEDDYLNQLHRVKEEG